MIGQLQYISSSTPTESTVEVIRSLCEVGVKWVQLRLKDESEATILEVAKEVRTICDEYEATFILNDYPQIAKTVQADGVHLGKSDMQHKMARELLGEDFIIGGTANTMEDVRFYANEGVVDYIGLGPFRFTTTKKNLSPILGIKGYQTIIKKAAGEGINLPIIAIGGIQISDIQEIMNTGVYGIAISGLLTNSPNRAATLNEILWNVNS